MGYLEQNVPVTSLSNQPLKLGFGELVIFDILKVQLNLARIIFDLLNVRVIYNIQYL